MNSSPTPRAIKVFAVLHIVFPFLGWLAGEIFYYQSFGLNSAVKELILDIPLFNSTYWRMSVVYGNAAADRTIYLTFFWMLSLIPLGIMYFWLGIWSALRIASGKQNFKLGSLAMIAFAGFVVLFMSFLSEHSFSNQTRLDRVVLRTDFKFVAYTCAAIAVLWAFFAVVQPMALLAYKLGVIRTHKKLEQRNDR